MSELTLQEVCLSISDGDHMPPPKSEDGIPFVTISDINQDNKIDFSNTMFVPLDYWQSIDSKRKPQVGDVLYTVTGSYGIPVYIDESKEFVFQRHIAILRPNDNVITGRYLYYLLKNPSTKLSVDKLVTGAIQKTLGLEMIRNMSFDIPSLNEQEKIVDVLSLIDKKIDNNNVISSNLEVLVKTIYDYWFVQFDFPDENGKPYKSSGGKMVWNEELKREIPEGWEVKKLPDVCDLQYGFPLSTELFGLDGKNVIRIRDIADNTVSAKTTENVGSEYLTHAGDLLVGMDGNFQMNYWTRNNEIVNQRITRIRQVEMPLMIIKMQIEPYISAKISNVARSTVGHLGDADFKNQPILCPNKMDYLVFENALNTIVSLRNENQQLASLRDFLLPMLMNGQVKIQDRD